MSSFARRVGRQHKSREHHVQGVRIEIVDSDPKHNAFVWIPVEGVDPLTDREARRELWDLADDALDDLIRP